MKMALKSHQPRNM